MITNDSGFISHEMLESEKLEWRDYQVEMIKGALSKSSLVSLPTGAGKTPIAAVIMAERILNNPEGTILMVAPTKPLVKQHRNFLRTVLSLKDENIRMLTGETRPDKREELWENSSVAVATPQTLKNDIVGGRVNLSSVIYLVVDECHRASGDYPYEYICKEVVRAASDNYLITALSASPGSSREEILSICERLCLERVDIRTSEDLGQYSPEIEVEPIRVPLDNDVEEMRETLRQCYKERLQQLKDIGVVESARKDLSHGKLQRARRKVGEMMEEEHEERFRAATLHAEASKIGRGIMLLESQGVDSMVDHFMRKKREAESSGGSKAAKNIMRDERVLGVLEDGKNYEGVNTKLVEIVGIISGMEDGEQSIIFTESRSMVERIIEFVDEHTRKEPRRFVGQSDTESTDGMTQKEQGERMEEFRRGDFDVLVATQVAEEGLDIPNVDKVIMYEPVGSAISQVQRHGRTGRRRPGKAYVLITRGTRDEGLWRAAQKKVDSMESEMKEMKEEELQITPDEIREINEELGEEEVTVIVDSREMDSSVPETLRRNGVSVDLESLEVADYVLSEEVAVERKSVEDFLDTLTGDRSLFEQVKSLTTSYEKGILLLEGGTEGLYSRDMPRNAVRGAIDSIAVDYGVSVIPTEGEEDSAFHLERIARREQVEESRDVTAHGKKSSKTLPEMQEFLVSSIPEIGPKTAQSLLEEFGTPRDIFTATTGELEEAEGVGPDKAEMIVEVIAGEYS